MGALDFLDCCAVSLVMKVRVAFCLSIIINWRGNSPKRSKSLGSYIGATLATVATTWLTG